MNIAVAVQEPERVLKARERVDRVETKLKGERATLARLESAYRALAAAAIDPGDKPAPSAEAVANAKAAFDAQADSVTNHHSALAHAKQELDRIEAEETAARAKADHEAYVKQVDVLLARKRAAASAMVALYRQADEQARAYFETLKEYDQLPHMKSSGASGIAFGVGCVEKVTEAYGRVGDFYRQPERPPYHFEADRALQAILEHCDRETERAKAWRPGQ